MIPKKIGTDLILTKNVKYKCTYKFFICLFFVLINDNANEIPPSRI